MSDISFDVSLNDLDQSPASAIFRTALASALDISMNLGISVVLEVLFPAYQADKNVWLSALEGVAEITLHVLLSNVLLVMGGSVFGTNNTLAPWGALVGVWMLNGALTKLWSFEQYLITHVSKSIASKSMSETPTETATEVLSS